MAEKLNDRELGAVLAGLRLLQGLREDRVQTGSAELDVSIDDIETSSGEFEPLTVDEIDGLCERMNCAEKSA
jgi:hypothetical protein